MAQKSLQMCWEYGCEIDRLIDANDYKGLKEFLEEVKVFASKNNTPEYAPVFYYMGTAYGALADQELCEGKEPSDDLVIDYYRWSMYYMRKAMQLLEDFDGDTSILLQIYTNYANSLDSCGRVFEALRMYRKAIELDPGFGMAVGNYGRALSFLASLVNDDGHCDSLHIYAYQAMKDAIDISDPNMHPGALSFFLRMLSEYEAKAGKEYFSGPVCFKEYDMGLGDENDYRMWCLRNHLFLNPMNEVIELESAFACDPITIVSYKEKISHTDSATGNAVEPPKYFAMLNQLKEEFVYARYLCYTGTNRTAGVHFADRKVKLSNGLDYSNYSIRLEQLKSAYRGLFSMFDKMAFFVNEFWHLGIKERDANAAAVFKNKQYLIGNAALMAIYWTYAEFYERYGEAENASAGDIKKLRNALEHKYVKVHEYAWNRSLQMESDSFYHISEEDLMGQTLRLLELVRECLMYLVYAVDIYERKRDGDGKAIFLNVTDFDDEWKV